MPNSGVEQASTHPAPPPTLTQAGARSAPALPHLAGSHGCPWEWVRGLT